MSLSRAEAWSAGLLVVSITVACSGDESPTVVAPEMVTASMESKWRSYDDLLAEFGAETPGFGGLYRSRGEVVVLLTGSANVEQVTQALWNWSSPVRGVAEAAAQGRLTFKPVKYEHRKLLTWRRQFDRGWRPDGVVAFDVDEVANLVRVFVADASVEVLVRNRAADLGIPDDAVGTLVSGRFEREQALYDRFRPIPGGVMVRRYATGSQCTNGATANTSAGLGFLTATHCTPTPAGVDYAAWYQNTNGASDRVGAEYFDPAPIPQGSGCNDPDGCVCTDPDGCRFSDASFVLFDDGDDAQYGYLARTEGLGSRVIDINAARFSVHEPWPGLLSVGDSVYLMGQVSGWRVGEIQYTCVDIPNGIGSGITALCQGLADYESTGGDSGGTIFTWPGYGNDVEFTGMHAGHFTGGEYAGLRAFSWWLYISLEFSDIALGVGN